jgi:hypothetical protein
LQKHTMLTRRYNRRVPHRSGFYPVEAGDAFYKREKTDAETQHPDLPEPEPFFETDDRHTDATADRCTDKNADIDETTARHRNGSTAKDCRSLSGKHGCKTRKSSGCAAEGKPADTRKPGAVRSPPIRASQKGYSVLGVFGRNGTIRIIVMVPFRCCRWVVAQITQT